MKYFSVESSDISVPNDWMDDPVRLLTVNWKGKSITGFNQSSRRCYVYPVMTPSGVAVTNERPTSDHAFHQSIAVGNDYFFTYQTSAAGRFEDPGMCFYTNSPDMRGRGRRAHRGDDAQRMHGVERGASGVHREDAMAGP